MKLTLGKRIRAERRQQDLTQEKLAELSGISDSFMGHIERGGRTLSIETLAKLADALDVSIEYIIHHPTDVACMMEANVLVR